MREDQGQWLLSVEAGDQVARMPIGAESEDDILEITTVIHVRKSTIQIAGGKLYSRNDGRGLVTNDYIEPSSDSHRAAIERKAK